MAKEKKTLRLLIVDDSQNEAERLVSLFRNAGHATRLQRTTTYDDLESAVQQVWDLLIAGNSDTLALEAVIKAARTGEDLPIIRIIPSNDSATFTEVLKLGVQDAVPVGEDERLILVATRELANLEERRARRIAEAALAEAEKRCALLLSSSADAIAYVHDGMHIHANETYLELFGYSDVEDLEGMPMIDLIAPQDQSSFKDFLKHYQTGKGATSLECSGQRPDGTTFKAEISFSPATYDDEPCIQVAIRPETDSAELEEKLREISSQDPVTGLANRAGFLDLAEQAIAEALAKKQTATIALIRLDRFSSIQADIGLADADQLLRELAEILGKLLGDGAHLARFSDDLFALAWRDVSGEKAEQALSQLLPKIEGHLFQIGGRTVQITLSIGLAELSKKLRGVQELVDRAHRCADEVPEGKRIKRFDPAEELAAEAQRGNVLAIVRQALETNGFRLLFQPIVSLRGDTNEHYEVLLRLLNPQGEDVPPADFLEAASTAGLASKIDRWVILRAVKMLAEHRAAGHPTRLFLHLSAPSMQDESMLAWLKTALKASHLPADALIFQLGEADAITYLKQAKDLAVGLKSLGCPIALSEFGKAQNPFNTLRHLPTDYVKLDGNFTKQIGTPEGQEALATMIKELQDKGKQSIVPFVENAGALSTIWQGGAAYIQGYYLQGPSPTMDFNFTSDDDEA